MKPQDPLYLSLVKVLKDHERAAALSQDKFLRRRFTALQQFWPADVACKVALNRLGLLQGDL
jgi:hypothetical protein